MKELQILMPWLSFWLNKIPDPLPEGFPIHVPGKRIEAKVERIIGNVSLPLRKLVFVYDLIEEEFSDTMQIYQASKESKEASKESRDLILQESLLLDYQKKTVKLIFWTSLRYSLSERALRIAVSETWDVFSFDKDSEKEEGGTLIVSPIDSI